MSKVIFFNVLFICLNSIVYSQKSEANVIINQILNDRIVKIDEVQVLSKQNAELTELHLKKLRFLDSKKFISSTNKKDQITLTQKEGKDLIDSIRSNYNSIWDKSDIKKISILKSDDVREFMNGDNKRNALILISKPVFIKNGEVAVVYFCNFIYMKELGYSDLCFYRKKSGIWKKWIEISRIKD